MHCRTCDYPLWNLKTRTCPECGTAFRPGEFEFAPNAVRFCCPQCDTAYYGTTPQGHLHPPQFTCVGCQRQVSMDEMVLRPVEGLDEHGATPHRVPWLHRRSLGGLRGWWKTITMAMTSPQSLMRGLPLDSSVGQSWWFAIVTNLIVIAGTLIPLWGCIGVMIAAAPRSGGGAPSILFAIGVQMVIVVLFWIVGLAIWGGITHAALRLTGDTRHTVGRTYQALCYSSGANIVSAIPCIGGNIGPIWWIISAILCVKEAQRVSGGRATFAVLVGPLCFIALAVAAYLGLVFWAINNAGTTGRFNMAARQSDIQAVTSALGIYAATQNNEYPAHAAQLVNASALGGFQLISGQTLTSTSDITVGAQTLDQFMLLPTNRQRLAAQDAADALPADVVAHRLGDYVFTYHGISPGSGDPNLWIVIASPDPVANPQLDPQVNSGARSFGMIFVGQNDGSVRAIQASRFASELAAQNQVRAASGLAPLPDPAHVTHGSPAAPTS
jgi:hypothetical protein